MTTRNRPFARVPRKAKVWATRFTEEIECDQNQEVYVDLLSEFRTDVGISALTGVTAMRIVGNMSLGNHSTASTSSPGLLGWGIAWVSSAIAGLSSGDATIPDPIVGGVREAEWLSRGVLRGTNTASSKVLFSAQGQNESFVNLDIKQMRKQPSPDHRLVLITNNGFSATQDVFLNVLLHTMIALP